MRIDALKNSHNFFPFVTFVVLSHNRGRDEEEEQGSSKKGLSYRQPLENRLKGEVGPRKRSLDRRLFFHLDMINSI